MSTSVSVGSMTVTSNSESAENMVRDLSEQEETKPQPKVLVNKGVPVEEEPEKEGLSKAASELGKEGAKAAAKARKAAAKEKPAEEAEPAEPKPAEPEPAEDEPEEPAEAKDHRGKPRYDPQARVAQATREAKEARETAQRERQERERLAGELQRLQQAREPVQARDGAGEPRRQEQTGARDDDPEPQEEDFPVYKDFVKATASWQYRQERQRDAVVYQAHQAASKAANEVHTLMTGWQKTLKAASEADPDFLAYVQPITDQIGHPTRLLHPDAPRTSANWIADDLMSAPEHAPALLRYLTEHADEFQRIASLSSPRAITRELAMIVSANRLDAATAGTSSRRSVSQAPPPVRPVTGSPRTADDVLDDSRPLSAFVRDHRESRLKASSR